MRLVFFSIFLSAFIFSSLQAQDTEENVVIDGYLVTRIITDEGDTLYLSNLDEYSITSLENFESGEDYKLYKRYRRYALKVYPYALEAIKIFKEVEYATENMKERERKKYIKKLSKKLKKEFEDPLKKLTKTQGMILTKMIEKELDTSMYKLIKNMRGGFSAGYWNTTAKFFGYKLKRGYVEGDDPILDAVLKDFDISYKN